MLEKITKASKQSSSGVIFPIESNVTHVHSEKFRVCFRRSALSFGNPNHILREVDSCCSIAPLRKDKSKVSGPAPYIENRPYPTSMKVVKDLLEITRLRFVINYIVVDCIVVFCELCVAPLRFCYQ